MNNSITIDVFADFWNFQAIIFLSFLVMGSKHFFFFKLHGQKKNQKNKSWFNIKFFQKIGNFLSLPKSFFLGGGHISYSILSERCLRLHKRFVLHFLVKTIIFNHVLTYVLEKTIIFNNVLPYFLGEIIIFNHVLPYFFGGGYL